MSEPRLDAIQLVAARQPKAMATTPGPDGRPLVGKDLFGRNVFTDEEMRRRLNPDVYAQFRETVVHGKRLERPVADAIAKAALEWSEERGVTHFCHWFHPLTGLTAEKHESFLDVSGARKVNHFSGSMLIQSEPDASSFPSGGMRSTFEARGYTAWDPTSPMFVMEGINGSTLCIPSCFISYHGDALDKKTPLLRSAEAINKQAVRLAKLLGDTDVTRVIPTAGPEQEYFLVDRAYLAQRPDLVVTGRSLQGARPPKGQTMEDHYFGAIPPRVLAFMQELEAELFKLGVPAKTRHNEVAPAQFELAVMYADGNLAADHNQIVMEMIRKVAKRHDFAALLHEKPFRGVNGSGKHLNWSVADNQGRNYLEPGSTPGANLRFLAFLSAVMLGVYRHGGVLRASVASHGNDFRLGANEAPPAIMSVFLGQGLTKIVDAIAQGQAVGGDAEKAMIELGVARLPRVAQDNTDRNRTSPFAFTGNKFEFRAVGANMSVSYPLATVNTVVADGLAQLCDWIEEGKGGNESVLAAVRKALHESAPVRFEGNNYSPEWLAEAERRGLPHLRNTAEALEVLKDDKVAALFARHGVLSPAETASRYHIFVDQYIRTVEIEVDSIISMVDQSVMAAGIAERTAAAQDLKLCTELQNTAATPDLARTRARYEELCQRLGATLSARNNLATAVEEARGIDSEHAKAAFYAARVVPALEALRTACDGVEERVADHRWPLPRYREMLFQN